MRIAVATVKHETNTFADGSTEFEDFEVATDDALLGSFATGRSIAGIRDALLAADADLLPTIGTDAIPGPTVTDAAFERFRDELLDRIEGEHLDGVCLDLHGSMHAEHYPDPEGALVAAIRETIGPDVPITAALDMHATITERLVEQLDGVAGYRTAPHTDVVETGERAASLLLESVRDDRELTLGWERLPMLLAGERSETEAAPMASLIERCRSADEESGILDANYFLGFPWADSPHAGCHALVTGDASDEASVESTATELAEAFWDRRDEFAFTTEAYDPETALDEAAATTDGPVVVADTGDIPGAGGSEDVVDFLQTVTERSAFDDPLVAVIADPDAYDTCASAGDGETVDLALGQAAGSGEPYDTAADVREVATVDGVGTARVVVDGTTVLVTEERTNVHRDPANLRDVGIEPTARDLVVLKSGYLSPAWKALAGRRLFALTRGNTDQVLSELPYERVPRPIAPIDEETGWSA
ncbi:MlrC domain-containing protein [Salinarchaeum sp. Harcht-Bsk1]|uniref:M81 family metallopeptidase n=1 Tax=Salinarchaeum sp. Harcht-Bsk1 TaxID=1333523 RepID=UPI00034234C6|nr:M81 family metallopeptidase [Salinarchaeum sp. Harcht-Bsk1]AGN00513.1 MlrC domain-containing protein [Salinarchaeum sp. Harcht-Bsk1]